MAFTKRQIVTGLSILYLLALTIIAAYALHRSAAYSLPIPETTSALTVALPPLAGIALETCISLNEKLAARGQLQASRIFQLTIAFFLVYETALATLASTHIASASSSSGDDACSFRARWQALVRAKDEARVREIQDSFQCCGLTSVRDMAWPFPSATTGSDACVVRYPDRSESPCLGPWSAEERRVGVMLLVVPVAVFLWMVTIALSPTTSSAWLPSQLSLPSPNAERQLPRRGPRAAVRPYRDLEDGGGDGDDNAAEHDSIFSEVNNLNKDSHLASHIEGNRRSRGSVGLRNEQDVWGEGRIEGD